MKKIGDILSGDEFTRIKRESEHIKDMHAVIMQALAKNEIHIAGCNITEFNNGELRLQGNSAADIFRVKQILPTLQDSLKKSGFEVTTIRMTAGGITHK